MPSLNANFDWVDTPNPAERGFSIIAKESPSDVLPDFLNQTVLWNNCPTWIKRAEPVPAALRGYTLVHCEKVGFQLRRFVFGKTRTDEERNTAFQEVWIKRPYEWPTVLIKLWFEKGSLPLASQRADGSIVDAARTHPRMKIRPGRMYPTWFRTRRFLSERPWPRRVSRSPTPITDSVSWSFDGCDGHLPEILHPGCRFPQYQTSGQTVFGAGTPEVEIGGDIVAQEFPPTPMIDWERYSVEDTAQSVGGFHLRELVEAYPPVDDRETTS